MLVSGFHRNLNLRLRLWGTSPLSVSDTVASVCVRLTAIIRQTEEPVAVPCLRGLF